MLDYYIYIFNIYMYIGKLYHTYYVSSRHENISRRVNIHQPVNDRKITNYESNSNSKAEIETMYKKKDIHLNS